MGAAQRLRDRTSTLKWAAQGRDLAKETKEWAKEKQNKKRIPNSKEFKKRTEELMSDAAMIR